MKTKLYFLGWAGMIMIFFSFRRGINKIEYFEGSVSYQTNIFFNKKNQSDTTVVKKMYGTHSVLFFKLGNFLKKYEGSTTTQQLYLKDDNKLYFKKNVSDTTFWVDCSQGKQDSVTFKLTRSKEKILGVDCDELVIQYKDRTLTDYFNSELFITDGDWLKNFKLNSQDLIERQEQGICLKHKIEYPGYTVISTATEVSRARLDVKLFEPPGKKEILKKSTL